MHKEINDDCLCYFYCICLQLLIRYNFDRKNKAYNNRNKNILCDKTFEIGFAVDIIRN